MNNRLKKIFFLLGDVFVLHLSLAITLFIRYRLIEGIPGISPYWRDHWFYFLGVFFIFILIFYINNLYSLRRMASATLFISQTINSVIVASLLSVIYFYAYPRIDIAPKTNLIIFTLLSLLFFLIWRRFAYWLIIFNGWKNKLAIIGYGSKIEELLTELQKKPGLGYKSAIIFKDISDLATLEATIQKENIKMIILSPENTLDKSYQNTLLKLLSHRVTFSSYQDFYEQVFAKVPIETLEQDWFLYNLKEANKNYFDLIKNIIDKVLALFFFLFSLPLYPVIALLIKLNSRGPVFFKQQRLGKNGKLFQLYKFRSMRIENNHGEMTQDNDQRITNIGQFLRKTRFDELPQLLNILKGQMSFIGPRPERPELAQELSQQLPFYAIRLLIKPGLTGWDQVSGEYHSPSPEDTLKKLQNDLYYLKHRSLYLDLSIIFKTITIVLGRGGR